ncbi:MAG: glycoside hydrolase family 95 protein, partial [Kiritimatiellaceae bacterium]|nr:glycoside hydrolase family 95 protein [Kiritimatiellaceae bacterium]
MFVNNRVKKYSGNLLLIAFLAIFCAEEAFGDQILWYEAPAGGWTATHESGWYGGLPLGNSRLGMVVYGSNKEYIVFNEDSLWTGWYEEEQDRVGSFTALQELRALIAADASQDAIRSKVVNEFASLYGYKKPSFGNYQPFFDAHVDFGHGTNALSNYRRSLDLETAVSDVTYSYQGTNYTREYFTSYPDQVGMMRFSADQLGAVNLTFSLTSLHTNNVNISVVNGDTLLLDGVVDVQTPGQHALSFQARLQFTVTGGVMSETVDANNEPAIQITNADEVVVAVAGATNYKQSFPTYAGEAPSLKNQATLTAIAGKNYAQLKAAHIADYSSLFSRVEFSLEGTDRSDLPTNARLDEYQANQGDRDFETLIFQYGRYLLISASRPGSQPANLQGIWNNDLTPEWCSDYHLNINLQMNYWLSETCNLSECFEPAADWTMELIEPGQKTAQVSYNSDGWVAHHVANPWGSTVPGPNRWNGFQMYEADAGAWFCQNIWEHYAFTQDLIYLQDKAWPLMKGAAEFWLHNLQELPNGDLVVSPSFSPEQGPMNDEACYSTMIVWDLFDNCIKATEVLDVDHAFAQLLKDAQARIPKPIVGEFGQLQEWRDPAIEIETDVVNNKHRHVAHMYAVHPGQQIIPERDPELAAAANQSLLYRENPGD